MSPVFRHDPVDVIVNDGIFLTKQTWMFLPIKYDSSLLLCSF
jgi:hypothetical protein